MELFSKGQHQKAAEMFRKAADQGEANAQAKLGAMYVLGQGVAIDESEAVLWPMPLS